jgi:hypothetical protein
VNLNSDDNGSCVVVGSVEVIVIMDLPEVIFSIVVVGSVESIISCCPPNFYLKWGWLLWQWVLQKL